MYIQDDSGLIHHYNLSSTVLLQLNMWFFLFMVLVSTMAPGKDILSVFLQYQRQLKVFPQINVGYVPLYIAFSLVIVTITDRK